MVNRWGLGPEPFYGQAGYMGRQLAQPVKTGGREIVRFGSGAKPTPEKKEAAKPETASTTPGTPPAEPVDEYLEQLFNAPKHNKESFKVSSEAYQRKLGLIRQLSNQQRGQVFEDLRMRHVGFWKNLLPVVGKSAAGVTNGVMRLPLHLARAGNKTLTAITPNFILGKQRKDAMNQAMETAMEKSRQNSQTRRAWFTSPFERMSMPIALEASMDRQPFFAQLEQAFNAYAQNGQVPMSQVDQLLNQLQSDPKGLKANKQAVETFVAAFPFLQKLSKTPDTVDTHALAAFRQNVKDSIPFLYELYRQNPKKYIEANLAYLGASDTLPAMGGMAQTGQQISNWLNEKPTYRKIARWAKENQLSDTQFLPLYSFVDALYGQTSAVVTGLASKFSMRTVFEQMVALDGVFNGVNFWITKFQILLVGWNKEKPDKQRAQYEKELLILAKDKQQLEDRLNKEKDLLAKKIAANPAEAEKITEEFNRTVLNPIVQETNQLTKRFDQFQRKLNKLIGVEEMGFFERMWKKPPELLNDLKVMVPISIPLILTYELLYINRYTDYKIDPTSAKFAMLVGYMTFLGAIGNVILKQIIHLTQDRAKLYLDGSKDELMANPTRETLANFKGMVEELQKSNNPRANELAKELDKVYQALANPLIGGDTAQASTEKALNRQAKLGFSMRSSDSIKLMMADLDKHIAKTPRGPEKNVAKAFRRYMKLLAKVHDRAAYIPRDKSKFELKALADYYRREIMERKYEHLLPKHQSDFFKNTIAQAMSFMEGLEEKYPKAEMPFEPLLLKANADHGALEKVLNDSIKQLQPGSSLRQAMAVFEKMAVSREDKNLYKSVMKHLKSAEKQLKRDLKILNTPSKEEAWKQLDDYRQMRKDYAKETKAMPFGLAKIKRWGVQMGMATKQVGKRMGYTEKYNRWVSGLPWIPAHSLLNVAGRLGLTSIVQGKILPFTVMLKVWLMFHIPIRLYIFMTEKFMVDRDDFHRKHGDVMKKMEHGMEPYIRQMLEEGKANGIKPLAEVIPLPQNNIFAQPQEPKAVEAAPKLVELPKTEDSTPKIVEAPKATDAEKTDPEKKAS